MKKIATITLTILFTVLLFVSCGADPTPPVTGVQLDKESLSLAIGNEKTLVATVAPENATNKKVKWSTSNAPVATVDQNGKVTAIAEGEATITVTTEDGGFTDTCEVTVVFIHVTGVTLNETSATISIGATKQLVATITPDNASDKSVTWTSSDETKATVDANGKVTGVAVGEATITVKSNDDPTKKAECTVTVVDAKTLPLTLEFTEPGTLSVTNPHSSLQYVKNNEPITNYSTPIEVVAGDTIKLYSNGTGSTSDDQMVINSTAYCYVYGNVMSLLYSTGFEDKTSLSGINYAFSSLFAYNAKIKNHESLSLELPATTLAEGCYFAMFLGCTSLTTAPTLPATTLATSCYYYMFYGCSVLNSITCLATSGINENYSTSFWLYDVAASGIFIKDSNVDEATWRATYIPDGWNFQDYDSPTI